jgi:hypothetical protein
MRMLATNYHPMTESFAAAHVQALQALADGGREVTDIDLYAQRSRSQHGTTVRTGKRTRRMPTT